MTRLDDEIGDGDDPERVAVGLGGDDLARTDRAAGARPVHHGQASRELLLHSLGDSAQDDVGEPARRKAHDGRDRPVGIFGPHGTRQRARNTDEKDPDDTEAHHGPTPLRWAPILCDSGSTA